MGSALRELQRDACVEVRRAWAHRILSKDGELRLRSAHGGDDLGGPRRPAVAYTLEDLRRLIYDLWRDASCR